MVLYHTYSTMLCKWMFLSPNQYRRLSTFCPRLALLRFSDSSIDIYRYLVWYMQRYQVPNYILFDDVLYQVPVSYTRYIIYGVR